MAWYFSSSDIGIPTDCPGSGYLSGDASSQKACMGLGSRFGPMAYCLQAVYKLYESTAAASCMAYPSTIVQVDIEAWRTVIMEGAPQFQFLPILADPPAQPQVGQYVQKQVHVCLPSAGRI